MIHFIYLPIHINIYRECELKILSNSSGILMNEWDELRSLCSANFVLSGGSLVVPGAIAIQPAFERGNAN